MGFIKNTYLLLIYFNFIFFNNSFAQEYLNVPQKPILDSSVFNNWLEASEGTLSNDGNYMKYMIMNGWARTGNLVIQSIDRKWKLNLPHSTYNSFFTGDSKHCIFLEDNDSLGLLTMGDSAINYIANVSSFRMANFGNREWMIYQLKDTGRTLLVRDLKADKALAYHGINSFDISLDQSMLILRASALSGEKLSMIRLMDGEQVFNWKGNKIDDVLFDKTDSQFCFTTNEEKDSVTTTSLWYYKFGMPLPLLLIGNTAGTGDDLEFSEMISFSRDGDRFFFNVRQKKIMQEKKPMASVDIWNWMDTKLQSQQLAELKTNKTFLATIRLDDKKITRLEYEHERLMSPKENIGEYIIVDEINGDDINDFEKNWILAYKNRLQYVRSTKTGENIEVRRTGPYNYFSSFLSPTEKFVIYYDEKRADYFSFEISTRMTRNITRNISTKWTTYGYDYPDSNSIAYLTECWLDSDSLVMLHDKFDIWMVDVTGKRPPVSITNGLGRKQNILFHVLIKDPAEEISIRSRIILCAFNCVTKDNGFYSKEIYKVGDPVLLITGPYIYFPTPGWKAKDKEVYLMRRESASESPNFYYTRDYKTFSPLTNVYPEKQYNWLTTELMQYKDAEGKLLQGILYKPENFNPHIKYPVIFSFYEIMSDHLNKYELPYLSYDRINVPWYVSHGYLVFEPDIHYVIGRPGQSALNDVVSAANYLKKFSWVNPKKMGIQGHSWGGYEVNYIVSHTNLFAAAMAASGVSDFISGYGSTYVGYGAQFLYEIGQTRMGATLWERPDLFLSNSPVLFANHIQTPLLLMNNKNDYAVLFSQGIELFTALRRMGKSCWLLQYDGEDHSLSFRDVRAPKDYSIRMNQFFDHYLKDAPAPKWMVEGIPAKMKGIDDGLELEPAGLEAGPGLLAPEEQKKVDALRNRKPITVTFN
jgi:dipeptidyl aminopeptidase/acylaminoacyl peptidase